MFSFIVYLTTCAMLALGQEEDIMVFNNKTDCINQLVEWCDGMQYPQQGVGMALMSVTYEDPNGYYRIFCSSDADGTNCTRNGMSWFTCSPDHVMTYKGRIMTNTSTDVDDDICFTASTAFNDLFVQNLSYDNTTMKNEVTKGFEAFFEQIAAMEEQIELIQKMLRSLPSLKNRWREFDDSFLFENPESESFVTGTSESFDTTSVGADSTTSVTGKIERFEATTSLGTDPTNSGKTDTTTSASVPLQISEDSTTSTSSILQGSDSTTSVPDALQESDLTTSVPGTLQGLDSTTTTTTTTTPDVPDDNQNNTQLQSNQVEKK